MALISFLKRRINMNLVFLNFPLRGLSSSRRLILSKRWRSTLMTTKWNSITRTYLMMRVGWMMAKGAFINSCWTIIKMSLLRSNKTKGRRRELERNRVRLYQRRQMLLFFSSLPVGALKLISVVSVDNKMMHIQLNNLESIKRALVQHKKALIP